MADQIKKMFVNIIPSLTSVSDYEGGLIANHKR